MGGNINFKKTFDKETEPILGLSAIKVQNEICKILDEHNIEYLRIGSVGHNRSEAMHSDIDVAIKCNNIEELHKIVTDIFGDCVVSETLYVVSIPYKYTAFVGGEKYVQVDFMTMIDPEYTAFRYECPDFKNKESNYKVGMKIMFMHMILNHCYDRLKDYVQRNYPDKNYKARYDFTPIGLYIKVYNGFKLIEQTLVTTDINRIMNMVMTEPERKDFRSVESLWNMIHSNKYKYPKAVPILEAKWFINSYKKGWTSIVPEKFNKQYWTNEEIYTLLDPYKQLHKINNILDMGEEK